MIRRENCVVCDGRLRSLKSLKRFPVYMGVIDISDTSDVLEDMNWAYCLACGCVQLEDLVDPHILYKNPHNSAVGNTWAYHNEKFSQFILKTLPREILEIGGANLKIANLICKSDSVTSYTVVDLLSESYENSSNSKVRAVKCSGEEYQPDKKFDCIVLSHTLEHVYDPVSFLKRMRSFLTRTGKIFVSIPNIENQLKHGHLNSLCFEHTYYTDHKYIEMMAAKSGLRLENRLDFSEFNSFYEFSTQPPALVMHKRIDHSRKISEEFFEKLFLEVSIINEKIKDKQCYVFGAHSFSQYLVNAGLNLTNIKNVLDNDKMKIGKRLYGSNLIVSDPQTIREEKDPIIILRVAQYDKEIKEQLSKINRESIII